MPEGTHREDVPVGPAVFGTPRRANRVTLSERQGCYLSGRPTPGVWRSPLLPAAGGVAGDGLAGAAGRLAGAGLGAGPGAEPFEPLEPLADAALAAGGAVVLAAAVRVAAAGATGAEARFATGAASSVLLRPRARMANMERPSSDGDRSTIAMSATPAAMREICSRATSGCVASLPRKRTSTLTL